MTYEEILKQYWGYDDFRGIQRDIIESIGAGRDTLGLMPTGGGKSITFQVPALAREGVCLVITPLIALMKDQVQHLIEKGIRAAAIYSGMAHQEILKTLENSVFGGVKILYVSPERLSSDLFQTKLRHIKVSFITVDEAHCISQWGYDFRPAYLQIATIRQLKPDAPVLALTATATPEVTDDIQERLGFAQKNIFRMSFERSNLAYIVRQTGDKMTELLHILQAVGGSAIVYARSRKRTKEVAQYLTDNNLSATYYHAGLETSVKDERQRNWQTDQTRVIVATNAFGMGIDKPDVRLVVHIDCPDSIEAYFQEAGRGGRDGQKAYAVLLYNSADRRKLDRRVADNFPEKDYIRDVYEHLAYYYQIGIGSGRGHTFEFNIDKFCITYRYFPIPVHSALKILQRAGYLHYETDPDAAARVMFVLERHQLNRLDDLLPREDAVITALLRNYGGLFVDYAYIDEAMIAQQAGITPHQVYLTLQQLSKRHILNFIPRRQVPYITYLTAREEAGRLIITPEVYEQRKTQFIRRIKAMLHYAEDEDICRSRQLLRYFGEEQAAPCGICDVCLGQHKEQADNDADEAARQAILGLLADGQRHHVRELNTLHLPKHALDEALRALINEEDICMDLGFLYLPQ